MLSWVYLIAMARGMAISGGDCLSMAGEPWSVGYFTAMLVMWIIMMVGMMVPSAIPMVLIYASIVRKHPAAPEAKKPCSMPIRKAPRPPSRTCMTTAHQPMMTAAAPLPAVANPVANPLLSGPSDRNRGLVEVKVT